MSLPHLPTADEVHDLTAAEAVALVVPASEAVVTTPRDLLVNVLADAIVASSMVGSEKRIVENASYGGEARGCINSAARIVTMLYGAEYDAMVYETNHFINNLTMAHDEEYLRENADKLADELATVLLDTI
jgi:hypothetical protein